MIKHLFKYLLIVLLAGGFTACSEDEGAQILGGLYEKVDIAPEPGMNLVGRVTDGKNPIEGAVVSDGFTVTTTDAQGVYQMRVKKSTPFVFVSVPADCEIPVENGMPKIYKKIALGDNDVVQRSFTLERTGKKERFTLLALADVQIGRDDEVVMLEKEVLPLLVPYVQQLDKPVYGISLGDLVWDNMPFHSVYKEQIRKIGVPVFQVIGNHDHDKAIGMDTEADHSFRAAFGPTYYSYNIGDCHFVVLDDVLYTGSSNYTAEITEAQMAWLEQDLKHVPKDKLIIIGVHIATSRRNRPHEPHRQLPGALRPARRIQCPHPFGTLAQQLHHDDLRNHRGEHARRRDGRLLERRGAVQRRQPPGLCGLRDRGQPDRKLVL